MTVKYSATRNQTITAVPTKYPRFTASNFFAVCRYLMLRARYRTVYLPYFFADWGASIQIDPAADIKIGHKVRIMQDFTAHFKGRVRIGNNVFFNRGCHLIAHEYISIGDNCLFGEMVSIHDENHVTGTDATPIAARGFITAPITIGNNVWVGAKATILQGVTIGDNAVIAANAVVTRDIPANTVAAGIPARILHTI